MRLKQIVETQITHLYKWIQKQWLSEFSIQSEWCRTTGI